MCSVLGLGVVVGVGDDEAQRGDGEDGDVAAHRLVVEGRLLVHEVRDDLVVGDRRLDDVADERRVVAGPRDRLGEVFGEGAAGAAGWARRMTPSLH